MGCCDRRFGKVLTMFKDSYPTLRITSSTLNPPLLTALIRKTDHLSVPGVDDMTLAAVQGSRFRVQRFKGCTAFKISSEIRKA